MNRKISLFLVSIGIVLVTLLPQRTLSDTGKENLLEADKRLAQKIACQGTNQPIRRVLESLSVQLKIPLRVESKTASVRLTVSGQPRAAHELMGLIAKTLNARWQRDSEGYLLVRPAPPRLSQAERDRLHDEFYRREWHEIVREQDRQTHEFFIALLDSSRLTDDQVLELVRRYPLISRRVESSKEALMCARLITWLTKEQLTEAFVTKDPAWGVKLTPEDVRKTGSDYDLGFTHLYISIRPDLNPPFQCSIVWIPTDPNDKSKKTMTVAF